MNVAIIGSGAAGLVAAYAAACNGNNVTVFEKNEKSGKKIYITRSEEHTSELQSPS